MTPAPPEGVVVVDKPGGWTSHDVVARIRRLAGLRRVGHAGTLDPLATGVLVVGLGRATRLLGQLTRSDKEYTATIRLGISTDSDDADGSVVATAPVPSWDPATERAVHAAMAALTGCYPQRPPAVSAIKVAGRRSYARVRAGESVTVPPREVTVAAFDLVDGRTVRTPEGRPVLDLDVRVACSAGTYVRSLARDLGAALGTGGHVTALRRTRSGSFTLGEARTLTELVGPGGLDPQPLGAVARRCFPCRSLTGEQASAVANGVRLAWPPGTEMSGAASPGAARSAATGRPSSEPAGPVALLGPGDRLLALVERRGDQAAYLAVLA